LDLLDVLGIDKEIILLALNSKILDFEDAIQSTASEFNSINYIITRNTKDYKELRIKALTPIEFIKLNL
jgi:hypothetical protein